MLFRSLRSLTGRALAAGAAVALTLFNAAQPTSPATITLTPAPAPHGGSGQSCRRLGGCRRIGVSGARPGRPGCPGRREPAPVGAGGPGQGPVVGFSWADPDGKTEDGLVWGRSRDKGGWSAWREVEQAGDGPDANSSEYRSGRAYSDGQWLDAGTAEVRSESTRRPTPAPRPGPRAGRRRPRPQLFRRAGRRPT